MFRMFDRQFFGGFRSMIDDVEKMTKEAERMVQHACSAGICITNNNGHIVIVGTVKSLRVNEQVVKIDA